MCYRHLKKLPFMKVMNIGGWVVLAVKMLNEPEA
jgi:hypothetical protein